MIVRPVEPDDFEDIARLTNHFIRNTAIHFALSEISPAQLEDAHRQAADRHPWLVAHADGRFAGHARAATWRARDAYANTCETAVYVEPAAHRRGIARALYTALLDDLTHRGFHTAVAGITLPNPPSIAFHEALGFTHVGTFAQVGRKFDQWHDVGFWQRHL